MSQSVYLIDASIAENIANIDFSSNINSQHLLEKLKFVTSKVYIYDFVASLKNTFDFIVGEDGQKLSGGRSKESLWQKLSIVMLMFIYSMKLQVHWISKQS